ncbi:MAG: ATP-binding cassette domain-containing protein [Planctomycetales bacterium]|nr:ATP-binding cassette domain-containing protein [Planctomycetales bacterium]
MTLREFYRQVRPQHRRIAFSLALLTLATVLKLAPPVATKLAIDHALSRVPLPPSLSGLPLPSDPFGLLVVLAMAVVVTSLLALLLHLWARWQATLAVQHVQIDVRRRAFRHALRLPLHRVYQLKSGGSASLVRYDAGGVAELIFSMLFNPWQAVVQLVGVLAVLLWVEWRLCLVGLLVAPIAYLAHRSWISKVRMLYRDIRSQRQHIDAQVTETFSGVRVVRAFGRRRSEENRFARANHRLVRKQVHAWWWSRLIDVFWGLAMPIASVLLLLYGGRLVLNGVLSIGDLTMLLVYLAMLLGPLATLFSSVSSFQDTLAGLDRLLDLFAESPAEDTLPTGRRVPPQGVAGQIVLRNVSFRYPGASRLALDNVSLELPAGQTVALVGSSGSGKSNL